MPDCTAPLDELDVEFFWSRDRSQLTIRTNMGNEAAAKIAAFESRGRASAFYFTWPDAKGWADYVFTV